MNCRNADSCWPNRANSHVRNTREVVPIAVTEFLSDHPPHSCRQCMQIPSLYSLSGEYKNSACHSVCCVLCVLNVYVFIPLTPFWTLKGEAVKVSILLFLQMLQLQSKTCKSTEAQISEPSALHTVLASCFSRSWCCKVSNSSLEMPSKKKSHSHFCKSLSTHVTHPAPA